MKEETKIPSVEKSAIDKLNQALDLSPSTNRYQALINLAHLAGIKLAPELKKYIDDPQDYPSEDQERIFGKVRETFPELIKYYQQEALAYDRLKLLKNLKIEVDSELFKEIDGNLQKLYQGDITVSEYQNVIDSLKIITVKQRIKHYLPEGILTDFLDPIIKENINNNDLSDKLKTALEQQGITDFPTERLSRICKSFATLQTISTPEKMHDKMVGNILDRINDDFKREIVVINDFKETTIAEGTRVFRSLNLELTKDLEEKFLNHPTRMVYNNNELLLFDVKRKWNNQRSTGWEVAGAYTSTNPYHSLHYAGKNGIMLEIVTNSAKKSVIGRYKNEWEIIFNQVESDEIYRIYKIENNKVSEIIENPNFHNLDLSWKTILQPGQNFYEYIDKFSEKGQKEILTYSRIDFNTDTNSYSSYKDFTDQYKPSHLKQNRQALLSNQGYSSLQSKFKACKNNPLNCLGYNDLFGILSKAEADDNKELLSKIIKDTPILTATDNEGNNLLMHAVAKDDIKMVKFALAQGFKLEGKNNLNEDVIELAIRSGSKEFVSQIILEHESSFKSLKSLLVKDNRYLSHSVKYRQEEIALKILDFVIPDQKLDQSGKNLLHYAIDNGLFKITELLIAKGFDVNVRSQNDKIPLHYAANFGHIKISVMLIEKGANVNGKDEDGKTPLHYTSDNGDIEHSLILLEKGANVNEKDKLDQVPLHYAVNYGHTELAIKLIEKGADINAKSWDLKTPLFYAARNSHTELSLKLIELGSNVNGKDFEGQTPLFYTAKNGHTELSLKLIDNGANVNVKDEEGCIPLHIAVAYDHTDTVLKLIEKGAHVNEQNNNNETPLHYAAYYGHHTETAIKLIDNGADINAKDKNGNTPLKNAVEKGKDKFVKLLLEAGAKVEVGKESLLTIAANKGNNDILQALLDKSDSVNAQLSALASATLASNTKAAITIAKHLPIEVREQSAKFFANFGLPGVKAANVTPEEYVKMFAKTHPEFLINIQKQSDALKFDQDAEGKYQLSVNFNISTDNLLASSNMKTQNANPIKLILSADGSKILASSVPLKTIMPASTLPKSEFDRVHGEQEKEYTPQEVIAELTKQKLAKEIVAGPKFDALYKQALAKKVPFTTKIADSYLNHLESNLQSNNNITWGFEQLPSLINNEYRLAAALGQFGKDSINWASNFASDMLSFNVPAKLAKPEIKNLTDNLKKMQSNLQKMSSQYDKVKDALLKNKEAKHQQIYKKWQPYFMEKFNIDLTSNQITEQQIKLLKTDPKSYDLFQELSKEEEQYKNEHRNINKQSRQLSGLIYDNKQLTREAYALAKNNNIKTSALKRMEQQVNKHLEKCAKQQESFKQSDTILANLVDKSGIKIKTFTNSENDHSHSDTKGKTNPSKPKKNNNSR